MPSKQVWMTQLGAYTEDLNDVKRECRLEINSSTINNPVGDWAVCETKYFSNMRIQIIILQNVILKAFFLMAREQY